MQVQLRVLHLRHNDTAKKSADPAFLETHQAILQVAGGTDALGKRTVSAGLDTKFSTLSTLGVKQKKKTAADMNGARHARQIFRTQMQSRGALFTSLQSSISRHRWQQNPMCSIM